MVDSTIREKLCQLFFSVFIFSVGINFNTTFASDTDPEPCDATLDATLNGAKIEIFETLTSKITMNVTNTSFLGNATLTLKTDCCDPIYPASNEKISDDFVVSVFDDLTLGSYSLKVENSSDNSQPLLFCALNAIKTENATCSDEARNEFSVSWDESLFLPWGINSTHPPINSIFNQSTSFTFSGLDAGQEYNVDFVRSSTTYGIETLIYEELTCVTLTACNFTNNSYIQELSLKNRSSDEIEVRVTFNDSCDACKWKINGNLFNETGVHVINTSNSNGNSIMQVINSSSVARPLFSCDLTDSIRTWNDPTFVCSVQTETTFSAKVTYDGSIANPSAVLTNGQNMDAVIKGESNLTEVNVSGQSLIPGSNYTFIVTHRQASNGILYMDKSFCVTTDVVNTENFTKAGVGTDYVTVSWYYPAIGEAKLFKLLWDCKAPSNCSSIQENSSNVTKNGTETITYNVRPLKPATTYELSLRAEIKGLSSTVENVTINTRPTKIDINATTDCQSSPTIITVTWDHFESGYDGLEYKIVSNATSEMTQSTTSYVFDTLKPHTKYNFSISAHRESVDGEATSFVCSTMAVPEIGNLVVADKNQTMIKLNWTYLGDLPETVEFEVFCQGSKNCSEGQLLQNSTDKEIQIENLLPGEEFTFVVRALVNQHPSSNKTLTVRTELNPPDFSNMEANSPDNQIQLPVFDCSQEQKVLNVSVFWTNENVTDNCDDVTDFELNQNFTVSKGSFRNVCNNFDFQLDPLNSAKGVHYGDNICLKLVLQSGEETSEAITEVPLFPDSISNLRCPRGEITTSSVQVSWGEGRGSFWKYIIAPSNSSLAAQLPENLTDISFNFTDIPHGTLLEFSVRAKAANGLESQNESVHCRAKVKLPEFSADVFEKTRMKINSEIDFNEAITNFSVAVYNRSTKNDCGQLDSVVFDQTFTDDISDFILHEQRKIFPGGVYCVEITTTAFGSLNESNSNIQKVALYPEVPEIETDVTSSTHATITITNYQGVIFDRIEYALFELVWNSITSDWTSQEFKAAQSFETTEVDFNDLPKGTVLTVNITAFSFANLTATNDTRFQTKPDTPSITGSEKSNTSCTFAISASKIVTAFEGKLNELGGEIKTIPINDLTNESVSALFTFAGLEAHTVYSYEFHAISDYEGFNSTSDKLRVSCKTEHGPPSRVRNLTITVINETSGTYNVSWDTPDRPNGPILGYNVTYEKTRNRFPSPTESKKTTQFYLADIFIAEGYTLNVTVFAFNDVNGEPTSMTQLRNATTKPKPNPDPPKFSSPKKSKSSLTIFIPCELFLQPTDINNPDENSIPLIAYYRMIVATGSSLSLDGDFPRHPELSASRSDSVYYASDKIEETSCEVSPNRARRSTEEEVKNWKFTVGNGSGEECQPGKDFCNPKLKAGKKYTIFIRAFSDEDTYTDVNLGQFRTLEDKPVLLIVILVLVSAILVVLVALVVAFVFRRFKSIPAPPLPKPKPEPWEKWSKPIEISTFREEYDRLCMDDGFKREFFQFTRAIVELDLPQRTALNPVLNGQNDGCTRNRWGDILPYDGYLVPLENGYINASYISGETHEKEYIATQGPMSHTEGDFWQMIWEQSVMQVVMLCQTVEIRNGAPKNTCHPYWPEGKDTELKGNVMTALVRSDNAGELWTRRVIKIQMRGMTPAREVIQYQFHKWDDRSSTRWEELEPLIILVDQEYVSSPIVVHCSAGVGRTGTFIMLHRLLQQAQNSSSFDIRGMIAQMRTMRPFMVQTVAQYKFVHDVGLILAERTTRNGVWPPVPSSPERPTPRPRRGVRNEGYSGDGVTTEDIELDSITLDSEHNNNIEQDEALIDFTSAGTVNPVFVDDLLLV